MELHTTIKKIRRNIEDYGWTIMVKKSLARLFSILLETQTYRIYRIDLDKIQPQQNEDNAFKFKLLGKDDVDLIRQVESMAEWLEGKLQSKIASKNLCMVALDRSKVAAVNLVYFEEYFISFVNIKRKLKPNETWSEHITVHRDYRKRGLASQLRYRMFIELKKRGIKKFYGGTLVFNEAALKLARKVGFKEIADIHYLKVLNLEKWRCKRVQR